ncbi:spermidine synthase [Cellulomonas sp. NS3]|uniref:spermidine synthase n=1 Tax=Cellulomonas sp. NS3 TaxID=2973977 RepID=UPI00216354F5|nr:spermidine synthase [Cellulomonas sp. NS3]
MPEQPARRPRVEELAWEPTRMGDLSLRRRVDPVTRADVLEIKLGDEFLMSSLFTVAEEELARLGLAMTGVPAEGGAAPLDVVVGGLGLGYTALTVLEDARVGSLVVVDALAEVIGWHRAGLIPAGAVLTADPRCRLVHADFFAALASDDGLDPGTPGRRWDAVLVDIDHSPRHVLNPRHASFYTPAGLQRLGEHLKPGGVFALWSNDPPDDAYLELLRTLLVDVRADVVAFPNPLQGRDATNTVYLGRAPG